MLLVLFVLAAMVMSGRSDEKSRVVGRESSPDPSIYNDRASGSKGFFEFVKQSGYDAVVWRRKWSSLTNSDARMLIAVAPDTGAPQLTGGGPFQQSQDDDDDQDQDVSTDLGPADVKLLKSWLSSGRTAVIMTSNLPSSNGSSSSTSDETFADALGISVDEPSKGLSSTTFGPVQPTPLADSVVRIALAGGVRIHGQHPDLVGIFGDRNGPVVAIEPVGKGRLIVIADGEFASNYNLGRADNSVFLGNLLGRYLGHGQRVLFDEFHHGDADIEGGGSVWTALGRPLQIAIVQIVLAMLVVIGVASSRFGTPVPLFRPGDRTSAEYVQSLATLYWKAGASTTALEMIYKQFLRELTSRLGLSADVNLEQLADAAARRGGVGVMEMRRLLALCEQHIDTGKVSEAELLDLVRRMDRIRKEIGIA